jgi:hypothetical protein
VLSVVYRRLLTLHEQPIAMETPRREVESAEAPRRAPILLTRMQMRPGLDAVEPVRALIA